MKLWHRIQWIGLICFLAIGSLLTLTTTMSTQARIEEEAYVSSEDPAPLGEACGAGELMPDWVICLHGTVAVRQISGEIIPLDGIPITITYNGQSVTGTTRILPGETMPTYGIDISDIEPDYLQSVTLTAVISTTPIHRQLIIAPNFNTQSQQYDVIVDDTGALNPGQLWGYVVDFSANGPVTNAIVTAEHAGISVSVTTTVPISGEEPIYLLDDLHLATLGVTQGDILTLTAVYSDDIDQQIIVLPPEPTQVNFVTGWKCDGFDPLPRSGSGDSLPRSGSGDSLPDVACFWGYALVDASRWLGLIFITRLVARRTRP